LLADDFFQLQQPRRSRPDLAGTAPAASKTGTALDFVAVLLHNGYVQDASKLMQKLMPTRPAKPGAAYLHVLARVREAEGRKPEARQLLAEALRLQPKSFDILFDCARVAAEENRWKDSVELLKRANEVKPDDPPC